LSDTGRIRMGKEVELSKMVIMCNVCLQKKPYNELYEMRYTADEGYGKCTCLECWRVKNGKVPRVR
jgi:hypothetical protein